MPSGEIFQEDFAREAEQVGGRGEFALGRKHINGTEEQDRLQNLGTRDQERRRSSRSSRSSKSRRERGGAVDRAEKRTSLAIVAFSGPSKRRLERWRMAATT